MPAEERQKCLEKKTWENVQVILVSKLNPDFFILLFIQNCESVKGD